MNKHIKSIYVEYIGNIDAGDFNMATTRYNSIEQINETTYAHFLKGKIVNTYNIRYVVMVTYFEN